MTLPHLASQDPDLAGMIRAEAHRQQEGLEMIASENIVSEAVLEALGSPLTNKYSEGYPGKRYYGGNEVVDQVESLAIERAKQLFGAEHANVQPHAGSPANLAAYMALAEPGSTIMAMDLAMGGHLTHGSPVNFSGKLYRFAHYGVNRETHLIDMDEVRKIALDAKPKILVAGFTAYSRTLDFAAFRAIADEVGAFFMVDMAHFAGLVAGKAFPNPVPHADIVTTTTHKTLRGPRGAMILCKKDFAKKIDSAVFPGMQGGPLEHVIAAKAVAFGEALKPEFETYQKQVVKNAQALSASLTQEGVRVITGGTDNHMLIADLTDLGTTGKPAVDALDLARIYTNMNMIPYDPRKPMDPSGLRIGTPALTTRGLNEGDMRVVGGLIAKVLKSPADESVRKEVLAAVETLVAAHPIYPEWNA
ncbi:MAG: serine hydroxymethyltransferase [Patescibacteria group bacterium]|nr:MAG: serine hydroxymethyltransferase [Patescibacteria group bacterium]